MSRVGEEDRHLQKPPRYPAPRKDPYLRALLR